MLVSDDAPQMLGYCVVEDYYEVSDQYTCATFTQNRVHGLTANDYVCDNFKEVDEQK